MAALVGIAIAAGVTLLVVGTVEVIMVLYRRVNKRLLANARQEGHQEGHREGRKEGHQEGHQEGRQEGRQEERRRVREWYASLPKEIRDQIAPPPEGDL